MKWSDERAALAQALALYIGLESLDIVEDLVTMCGEAVDARALPVLRRRLSEEAVQATVLEKQGYARMAEKSVQLVASLRALITALEGATHDAQ